MLLLLAASPRAWADPCNAYQDNNGDNFWCSGTFVIANCAVVNPNCDVHPSDCGGDLNITCNTAVSDPPPPPPPPPPSKNSSTNTAVNTAATVNSDATVNNATTVANAAANSGGSQSSTLKAADEITSLGANQLATIGAIFCAQGANEAAEQNPNAPASVATCQSQFAAAQAMQALQIKMGKNGAYTPDAATMNQEGTKSTLGGFEKNYGVAPDEFMKRMLGGGNPSGAFQDMLGSKLTNPQLEKLLADAAEIHPDASKIAVDLSGKSSGAAKRDPAALRSKLKEKMSETSKVQSATTTGGPAPANGKIKPPAAELEDLTPQEGLFAEEKNEELTIFGVVHLKYEQLRKRWGRR